MEEFEYPSVHGNNIQYEYQSISKLETQLKK